VLLNAATYYPAGPSAGWTYGNGRVMTRTYDKDYRASTIKEAGVGGIDIGLRYDNAGYLTQLTNAALATTPRSKYQYDALGRLLKSSDGSTNAALETYTYDATGNRSSVALGTAAAQAYTYQSTSHKLTQVGSVGRTYDAMGNLTSVGGISREYVYNNAGRMSATKQNNAITATYVYNGLGEQVKRTVGATVTVFVYDEGGMLLGQYTGTGTPVQQYVWMDNLPVGVISSNTLHYVEADHLGTPRAVIDAIRQTAIWTWDLKNEAFGNAAPNVDPDADGTAFNLDLRMPGQRYDQASGLYYNYFRDYDPATGRYTQVDPIGLAGGISTFGYVGGNPLGLKDPKGLDFMDPVFGVIYDLTGGASVPQGVVDGAVGFGDGVYSGITFGIGDLSDVRGAIGIDGGVNKCSSLYGGFHIAGSIQGGFALGGAGGAKLSNATKGAIGEWASIIKNTLAGNKLLGRQVREVGFRTIFDAKWLSRAGKIFYEETKFGTSTLTKAQRAAQSTLGDAYVVQRWGYDWVKSVGAIGGGSAGGVIGAATATDNSCSCK
jgi:RHS repeat-associated protein